MKVSDRLRAAESPYEIERVERQPPKPSLMDDIPDSVFQPLKSLGWKISRDSSSSMAFIYVKPKGYTSSAGPSVQVRHEFSSKKMAVHIVWPYAWGDLGIPGAKGRKAQKPSTTGPSLSWGDYSVFQQFPADKSAAKKLTGILKKYIPKLAKGAKANKGKEGSMKISEMVRRGGTERKAQQSHRDPNKVAAALLKAENDIYKMRGQNGGWVDASSWLGDMLRDATGLSGSFYKDKELTKLKDEMQKIDHQLMRAASFMNAAARRIKKEHAANEKKKKEQGY